MKVNKMECKKVEELISEYIENELPREVHKEISLHLEICEQCRQLKEKVEELIYAFPGLEEEVPFFLKNRLYYIPESQDNIIEIESKRYYLKWVAAVIGTFVLCLNLFYFTNIYPPVNRILHEVVSGLETFAVKTGAAYERVKESKILSFLISRESNGEEDTDIDKDKEKNKQKEISMEKKIDHYGGKNG
jgi:predicted anti-sigma-YlaC factor YlaD